MPCGLCGAWGHNIVTCSHNAKRTRVAPTIAKSEWCECCGRSGLDIVRHHTRGRGDDSDFLDVCRTCHLYCCHAGDFNNFAIKPRVCRITGDDCYWRGG